MTDGGRRGDVTEMAREKPDYRATLELLRSTFPGRVELGMKEVSELLNRDRRTLLKDRAFPARMIGNKYSISITALARCMS